MDTTLILSSLLFYLMGAVSVLVLVAAYQIRPSVTKGAKPTPGQNPSSKPNPPAIQIIVEGGKPKSNDG